MDRTLMFQFMQRQNLNCVSMFYKHVSIAINEVSAKIDTWQEIDKGTKKWWKTEFKTHYPQKMLDTSFLLMFGHLEEMLFLLQRSFNPKSVDIEKKEYGIKKFKPYIKSLLGDQLKDYQFIVEAHSVRNSLLHCAGRVSLLNNRERIEKVLERHPEYFGVRNDRIFVKPDGLQKMQVSIDSLTQRLLDEVNRLNLLAP